MYTSSIPRIDMQLNEDQIMNNKPASGILIFEEHNLKDPKRTAQNSQNPSRKTSAAQLNLSNS